ncbi:hypothetical protein DFH94DRAFT_433985 [Russula ochroleuca]|uniref:F-box domain-containing protein n=1 Tax=Russula ochroleuca TaxID=152965 RepID=A0A9P5T9H0_9AGAM|nr:hypothetical protein DFH94DRAFT_433985 [Russula ochroleuca]
MPLPFPVEIVEYILDFADYPDLTSYLSPPYHLFDHDLPLPAIHLSARELFSCALVCKQWNTICTPRLYRILAISDSTAIDTLILTLEHSRTTATISGKILPLGSLTRHLIIALSDSPLDSKNERFGERFGTRILRRFGNLGRLARCLPHLQNLSISISTQDMWGLPPPHYGKDFAAAVTQTSAHSLLKLHLQREPFVLFSRRELRTLLESTPNLVAITGASVGDTIGCPVALPYLPKLKYLAVNDVMGYCDRNGHEDNRTPVLEYIHIRQHHLTNYCAHLLSAQGARLRTVSLDLRLTGDPNCSDRLSMLNNFCPNLSHLEISIDDWASFPRLEPLPPVERLGVRLRFGNSDVATICNILATIQSSSLEVVQLMNPGMFERFASDNVESAWEPLVFRTFRVVDCDGRKLGPPGPRAMNQKGVL